MSKQDRQGVRTPAGLEQKYNFGKTFAELYGMATDARESVDSLGSALRNEILEQATSFTRSTEQILITALEKYAETSDLEELKKTMETQFNVWAGGIAGRVTAAEESIRNVDGDLQNKFNEITKYFTFDINGLLIGAVDEDGNQSPNKVVIDNDDITIMVSGSPVLTFKADGTGVVPSLSITQSLNLLGLNITSDSTHINCVFKEVT